MRNIAATGTLVLAWLGASLCGCQALLGIDEVDTIRCESWRDTAARLFDPCAIPDPGGELVLAQDGAWSYDTGTGTLASPDDPDQAHVSALIEQTDGTMVRVISADSFRMEEGVDLRVTGDHPLLIASWGTIDMGQDAVIDVSSRPGQPGAGRSRSCGTDAAEPGVSDRGGGSGGGGGGFGGEGGDGGGSDIEANDVDGDSPSPGGRRGLAAGELPGALRGGCAGARGGAAGVDGPPGGAGGAGGGAIHLAARVRITVGGGIHAAGAGGRGGRADMISEGSGGGGGGSGGFIGLNAPRVILKQASLLTANGGGGGEGADWDDDGAPGSDGPHDIAFAPGGAGQANSASDGGPGGWRDEEHGRVGGAPYHGGGAGGGGGAGFIVIYARAFEDASGQSSPRTRNEEL
jgi:hypothetical protein